MQLNHPKVREGEDQDKECGRNKLASWRRMIVRIQGATTGT